MIGGGAVQQRASGREGDFRTTLRRQAKGGTVWPLRKNVQRFAISRVRGWKIFAPDLAKTAAPFVQPNVETFVGERLLDDDVGCAVAVNIQGCYRQRGFVGLKGEVPILPAGEMKLDGADAALRPRPAMIDKDSAIDLAVTVEIGSGKRLSEGHPEIGWRCQIRPRPCAFEAVLSRDPRRWKSQRSADDEFYAKRPQIHL